jgi:hypothetical protein
MAKFKNHIARILEKQNRLGGLGFQGFYDAPQFQAASTMAGLHLPTGGVSNCRFRIKLATHITKDVIR